MSERYDIAVLSIVFVFGAFLSAFGMVTPVYALQESLAALLGTTSEAIVLGVIFIAGLACIPTIILAAAALPTRLLTGSRATIPHLVARFSYSLVPVGFGVWVAHFLFHFLTGALTIVPVLQSTVIDLGWQMVGLPQWDLGPMVPPHLLFPIEVGLMSLGWLASLLVAYRIAEDEFDGRPWPAFIPWAGVLILLLLAGIWLMAQPMEMRATFLA